ncbi:MAG: TetR/AcrR family transcriptional regulator [Clostridiales bacterium]|nr:TetR/AcrR family transcriptional regulator [Clostridiales bacterium]
MATKPYHHGNLKHEFIEKGLEYIDEHGVESLSMRKLAESIGVSSAAPYAHFKNKEAFLDAITEYVTESLTEALQEAVEACTRNQELLIELGKAYVIFFYENPLYYQFLFGRGKVDIHDYPPFQLYSEVAEQALKEMHKKRLTKATIRKKLIAMWALVHGLAQFALTDGLLDTDKLDSEIAALLCAVDV